MYVCNHVCTLIVQINMFKPTGGLKRGQILIIFVEAIWIQCLDDISYHDDYLKIDSYISKTFGLEELSDEFSEMIYNFETNAVPLNRQNDDRITNNYGNMMIDFCKNTNLLILNGRLGNEKNNKQVTCKERSTVDYFRCTYGLFDVLQNLEVCKFDHLFSDAHSPLTVDLNIDSMNRSRHENFSCLEPEKNKTFGCKQVSTFF